MTTKTETEKEQLEKLLEDDYSEFTWVGTEIDGFETIFEEEVESGRWESHHEVITKTPSGKLYKWKHSRGLTENQDNERYDTSLTEVVEKERTIVQKYYEEV